MPPKRVPKDVKIWNADLTRAAEFRYAKAAREHRRDENEWRKAKDLLAASQAHIYRQKTGENAGIIVNIPKKISIKIVQVLMKIIDGTLPITDHLYAAPYSPATTPQQGIAPKMPSSAPTSSSADTCIPPSVSIEMTSFYRNRKYGDSCTALLAGMYASLRPQADWVMSKDHILHSASRYTDLKMDINFRTGEHGAWSGIKQLEANDLVKRVKKGLGVKQDFALTLYGRQLCHSLFTKKIHPSFLPGIPLIQSPYAQVDAAGNVTPIGVSHTKNTGPAHTAALHSDWRRHERQWLGLNDDESDMHSPSTPPSQGDVHIFRTMSSNALAPCMILPDDDLMRALRCSKLEKSTGKATYLSAEKWEGGRLHGYEVAEVRMEEEEEAQLKKVLEISMQSNSINDTSGFNVAGAEGGEEEAILSRVLKLSEKDNMNNSQVDTDGELNTAITLSLLDSTRSAVAGAGLGNAPEEEEHRQFETARRLSMIDSTPIRTRTLASSNSFKDATYKWLRKEEEGEEEEFAQDVLDVEKREYEEALRLSLATTANASNATTSQNLSLSSRRKRIRPLDESRLPDSYSQPKTKKTKMRRLAPKPPSGREEIVLDLTGEEIPYTRMGRGSVEANKEHNKATLRESRQYVELPCLDLIEIEINPPSCSSAARSTAISSCHERPCIAKFDLTEDFDATSEISSDEVYVQPTAIVETKHSPNRDFDILASSSSGGREGSGEGEEFHLVVDTFERVSQNTFRQFYERIDFNMQQYVPFFTTVRNKLTYGDFQCTVTRNDCEYSLDFIVERKTLNDIVSRSNDTKSTASLAAPHVKQATTLQHCGLAYPFFLIEGDISKMHVIPPAKVDYVGQVSVDMLATTQDLMTFMAQMLAREWSSHKISLLQTWHSNATAMLLVCMSYFARQRYEARHHLPLPLGSSLREKGQCKYPRMTDFRKNMITAKTIKSLYGDLKNRGIHVEMCARVARRFGSWKVLCQAYSLCSSEQHAQVMLADLSPGSTKPTVIDGIRLHPEDTGKAGMMCQIEVFDDLCMMRESRRVFDVAVEKFSECFSFPSSLQFSMISQDFILTKTTAIEVSKALHTIFDGTSLLRPPGIVILTKAEEDDDDLHEANMEMGKNKADKVVATFPWVSVATTSRSVPYGLTRTNARQRLVVIPGDVMLTMLVQARELLGPPSFGSSAKTPAQTQVLEDDPVVVDVDLLPYCQNLIEHAMQLFLFPALPAGWSIAAAVTDSNESGSGRSSNSSRSAAPVPVTGKTPIKYQIILEELSAPMSSHAAVGRLMKAFLKGESNRLLLCSTDPQERLAAKPDSKTLQFSKEGEHLPVDACRDIITIFPRLLPMLLMYLNTECNECTAIQTRNSRETKIWIETYCKAIHEESLLF